MDFSPSSVFQYTAHKWSLFKKPYVAWHTHSHCCKAGRWSPTSPHTYSQASQKRSAHGLDGPPLDSCWIRCVVRPNFLGSWQSSCCDYGIIICYQALSWALNSVCCFKAQHYQGRHWTGAGHYGCYVVETYHWYLARSEASQQNLCLPIANPSHSRDGAWKLENSTGEKSVAVLWAPLVFSSLLVTIEELNTDEEIQFRVQHRLDSTIPQGHKFPLYYTCHNNNGKLLGGRW